MILREHVPFRIPRTALLIAVLLALLTLPGWSQSQPDAPLDETAASDAEAAVNDSRDATDSVKQPAEAPENAVGPSIGESAGRSGNRISVPPLGPAPKSLEFAEPQSVPREPQLNAILQQVQPLKTDKTSDAQISREIDVDGDGHPDGVLLNPAAAAASGYNLSSQRRQNKSARQPAASHGSEGSFQSTPRPNQKSPGTPDNVPDVGQTETIILARTTYRLPAAKAHALEQFIKQHVPVDVHTRIEGKKSGQRLPGGYGGGAPGIGAGSFGGGLVEYGDGGEGDMEDMEESYGSSAASNAPVLMTITTTPDAQRVIGQFILLMLGKTPPVATPSGLLPTPSRTYLTPSTDPVPDKPLKPTSDLNLPVPGDFTRPRSGRTKPPTPSANDAFSPQDGSAGTVPTPPPKSHPGPGRSPAPPTS